MNMLYSTGLATTSANFAVHVICPPSVKPMLLANIYRDFVSCCFRRLLHPLLRLHSSRRRCFGIAQGVRGGKPELFQGLRSSNSSMN